MKTLFLLILSVFALQAQEILKNEQLQVLYDKSIGASDTYVQLDDDLPEEIMKMVQQDVPEAIRKDFFPQAELALNISENRHIHLNIKEAELRDAICYWNFCYIYAKLFDSQEPDSYTQPLNEKNRRAFLMNMRDTLLRLFSPEKEESALPRLETSLQTAGEHPSFIGEVYHDQNTLYINLYIAETKGNTDEQQQPLYQRFETAFTTEAELKRLHIDIYNISPTQYHFSSRLLHREQTCVRALTSIGCFNIQRATTYPLSRIIEEVKQRPAPSCKLIVK